MYGSRGNQRLYAPLPNPNSQREEKKEGEIVSMKSSNSHQNQAGRKDNNTKRNSKKNSNKRFGKRNQEMTALQLASESRRGGSKRMDTLLQSDLVLQHRELVAALDVKAGVTGSLIIPLDIETGMAHYLKKIATAFQHYRFRNVRLDIIPLTSALINGSIVAAPYLDRKDLPSEGDGATSTIVANMLGSTGLVWIGGAQRLIKCWWPREAIYRTAIYPMTAGFECAVSGQLTSGFVVTVASSVDLDNAVSVELVYEVEFSGYNTSAWADSALTGGILSTTIADPMMLGSGLFSWMTRTWTELATAIWTPTYKNSAGVAYEYAFTSGWYAFNSFVNDNTGLITSWKLASDPKSSQDFEVGWSDNGKSFGSNTNVSAQFYLNVKSGTVRFNVIAVGSKIGSVIKGVVNFITILEEIYTTVKPFLALIAKDDRKSIDANGSIDWTRAMRPFNCGIPANRDDMPKCRADHIYVSIDYDDSVYLEGVKLPQELAFIFWRSYEEPSIVIKYAIGVENQISLLGRLAADASWDRAPRRARERMIEVKEGKRSGSK